MTDDEFAEWFARDYPSLVAAVTLVAGSRGVAEEAVAEAFMKAYVGRSGSSPQSPSAWVYRVAINEVRSRWRRSRHERRYKARQRQVHASLPDTDPELWATVASLPLRQREVVALRYVASYTQAEIAEVLGITAGTVASTLHDARAALAVALQGREPTDARNR